MPDIILVAESGADIPQEYFEKFHIFIVPMHVQFGNYSKSDGSFSPQEIVNYFQEKHQIPKTSGANTEDFERVFDKIEHQYPGSEILYLAYSAVTTCSFSCARIAAEGKPWVHALDTKLYTIGQGMVVIRMAELLAQNPEWTIQKASEEAERLIRKAHVSFVPQHLEYLVAGGRVKNKTALLAGLLHIHPRIDAEDGYLVAGKKYRGKMERTAEKLVRDFVEEYDADRAVIWFCRCPGASEQVQKVMEDTVQELGFQSIRWADCGGVITSHGGEGAIGIAGFSND